MILKASLSIYLQFKFNLNNFVAATPQTLRQLPWGIVLHYLIGLSRKRL